MALPQESVQVKPIKEENVTDYLLDDDVMNHVSIKEKTHQIDWLKPFIDKLKIALEVINHPNDKFGLHHLLRRVTEKTDQFLSNAYGSIYGLAHLNHHQGQDYPFPYKLKK